MAELDLDKEKIIRYFNGNYSITDELYVKKIFYDNNRDEELKKLLLKQFDELSDSPDDGKENLEDVLCRIHYDINSRLSEPGVSVDRKLILWAVRIAIAIMLPVLCVIGFRANKNASLIRETWVEINAPAWTRAHFSLPDGTMGWLNSNSTLRYKGTFNTDRQVFLQGEAYFDVHKNPRKPFTVNTTDVSLKVLGTRFNIASYENEDEVDVVLEEGKLLFNSKVMSGSYSMQPNELITYHKDSKAITAEMVQPQKYILWTEGRLVFRNDPLDVIARRLERWYNIEVTLEGKVNQDFRWRATFVDENLEEVLNILKYSLAIDYRIEKRSADAEDTYGKKKVTLIL